MSACVIFGGGGYLGLHLARHFLQSGRFSAVHLADVKPRPAGTPPGLAYSVTDVRRPIPVALVEERPQWVFNLAAVHREPGHRREEYFETNLAGARHVCRYADLVGCDNIYFSSSISVYGPTRDATDERAPIRPATPYGASKLAAELIHEQWFAGGPDRRLVIARPGVIYGPGDPGNMGRMIRAIRRGYFAFPGSPHIRKSYAYVYGLVESVVFLMNRPERFICYNYVETPTLALEETVRVIKRHFKARAVVLSLPIWLLLPLSSLIQIASRRRSSIHPVRVRKAATPTDVVPRILMEMGFPFQYSLERSLVHWRQVAPEDFGEARVDAVPSGVHKLRLRREPEPSNSDAPPPESKTRTVGRREGT